MQERAEPWVSPAIKFTMTMRIKTPLPVHLHRQHYGEAQPPDVAGYYGLLDCPVDICAGRADGVIAKENVRPPC